ncbi:UDP-N-acetylenolpyruvoylglucosamine reductase [Candidatus Parcubacteria bacterium A4]|nr:MAG: UDP-N-acetylenolpyruvoylglucosamine reductase [Candidatus Parcubacteria bacterium A4]
MEELKGVKKNVLLREYTTFRIGGLAKYFFVAKTKEELIEAIGWARENNIPFFILGGGSNVLVLDEEYNGLIIKITNSKLQISNKSKIQKKAKSKDFAKFKIIVGAGMPLAKLVSETAKNGLTGMEWAAGVPGTVGGAIRGNAGAFGGCMAEAIKMVTVLEIPKFLPAGGFPNGDKIKKYKKKDCRFKYRDSIFKHDENLIILSVEIELEKGDPEEINRKMKEHLDYRRNSHPLSFPSAGSIFKNPNKSFSAGDLIERCGLKGKTIGGAQISEKHANFIVNLGGAKAKDVLALVDLAKKEVKGKFDIALEEEIIIL